MVSTTSFQGGKGAMDAESLRAKSEELMHEEGQTLIQQKLDAWLAEQDSANGKAKLRDAT
jgi:hypothetical protein